MSVSSAYTRIDRLLHTVAFGTTWAQLALADIEDRLFRKQICESRAARPIFITSLPRAGTTMLLEMLSAIRGFASHTYRDMPFILCPIFWDRISAGLRQSQPLTMRAHDDGIAVNPDSPEAFEEVAWKCFWKSHFEKDRIIPWQSDEENDEFSAFLRNHMNKIVMLRSSGDEGNWHYLSKNNANVARIGLLSRLFPEALIVVAVRNPWDHCRSLHHQHQRFGQILADDPFGKKYMEAIGHYEFGPTLRPIDFKGWIDRYPDLLPSEPKFWLVYWKHAFRSVLDESNENVVFVNYDRICVDSDYGLDRLGPIVGKGGINTLLDQLKRLRAPNRYTRDWIGTSVSSELEDDLDEIYHHVVSKSEMELTYGLQ